MLVRTIAEDVRIKAEADASPLLLTAVVTSARIDQTIVVTGATYRLHLDPHAGAVSVQDVPDVSVEPPAEERGRQGQRPEVVPEVRRQSTDVHVAVILRTEAEVQVGPEGEAALRHAVNGQGSLRPVAPDLDVMPSAVVDRRSDGQIAHVGDLKRGLDVPRYVEDFEEVAVTAVVDVQEKALALCGAEVEGNGAVLAAVPFGKSQVGNLGPVQKYGFDAVRTRRKCNDQKQRQNIAPERR